MSPVPFQNFLSIREHCKSIPYGGRGELEPDGSANYGFKDLKGHPELVDSIPELREDSALRSLVVAILQPRCGLFSVGCLSEIVDESQRFRMAGYIELAINSKQEVGDPQNYFALFFNFDRHLCKICFDQHVQLNWELEYAMFSDSSVDGLTCSIIVNTHWHSTVEEARVAWNKTLHSLEEYFAQYPVQGNDAIYGA